MVVLALGVLVALEAWDVRGEPVPLVDQGPRAGGGRRLRRADPRQRRDSPPPPARTRARVQVPRVWSFQPAVYVHVRATAVFAHHLPRCSSPWLGWRGSRHLRGALVVLGLLIAQMIVGEVQYRTHLPLGLVILHVTLSSVVWAATVVVVATIWRPGRDAAQ